MHSHDTVNRFIELRAQGKSLMDISEKISIPKSTLHDWQKRHADEIQLTRAGKWEYVETGFGFGCEEDLGRLIQCLRRCEEELSRRSLSNMSDTNIMRLTFATRREYFKRRNPLLKPLEHPRRTPNPPLNLSPDLNGHTKPEKTGRKPEIYSNHRNGSNLHEPDSPIVAHDVRSGLISSEPSENRNPPSADAVHDSANPEGRATCPHDAASQTPPADAERVSEIPSINQTTVSKLIAGLQRLASGASMANAARDCESSPSQSATNTTSFCSCATTRGQR
jgi:hypothetical protein